MWWIGDTIVDCVLARRRNNWLAIYKLEYKCRRVPGNKGMPEYLTETANALLWGAASLIAPQETGFCGGAGFGCLREVGLKSITWIAKTVEIFVLDT